MLVIGYAIFALSSLLMISLTGNSLYAYVLAAIFGLYAGISETVQRAVVPQFVAPELRGTAFGLFNLVVGVCFFASNVVFGFLWDNYSLSIAVFYSIILTMVAGTVMFLFIGKYHGNRQIV